MTILTAPQFFIDSADPELVHFVLDKLPLGAQASCLGVTTNPSAFNKVGVDTVEKMYTQLEKLTAALEHYIPHYQVHIQVPNSKISIAEFNKWELLLLSIQSDMPAGAGFVVKIPPRRSLLTESTGRFDYNVTGLADASTCFACANFDEVQYVSLIPGRMSMAGINESAHMEKLYRTMIPARVIAGSMRTIVGLKSAIRYGTIPTIGSRVWNLFTDREFVEFSTWWSDEPAVSDFLLPEESTVANIAFSSDFFVEMDTLGQPLYIDFINK